MEDNSRELSFQEDFVPFGGCSTLFLVFSHLLSGFCFLGVTLHSFGSELFTLLHLESILPSGLRDYARV